MRFLPRGFSIVTIGALLCTAALLAGCGSSSSSSSSSSNSGEESSGSETVAFTAKPKVGIPGALLPSELKLWKYNSGTGKYDIVAGNASKPFEPELHKFPAGTKLGYIDPWAANSFAIPIREGMEELSKKYGFELVYCDAAFKPEKEIECAEEVAHQEPDFVVAGSWLVGPASAMMDVFDKAKIPATSMDISMPNAIFVGTNNYIDGNASGKAAGEFAKKEWNCEEIWVLLGENKQEGEAADLRLQGFSDGVQEICGGLPEGQINRVPMTAGTSDQALTVTTDWLTAHPQAKHVLGATLDDERGAGMAKSFTQATETEAYSVGMGCDTVGIETMKQAEPKENHFLGGSCYFPEKYPELLVKAAQTVLAGEPMPNEVHIESKFLDHETIDQYYPN